MSLFKEEQLQSYSSYNGNFVSMSSPAELSRTVQARAFLGITGL